LRNRSLSASLTSDGVAKAPPSSPASTIHSERAFDSPHLAGAETVTTAAGAQLT
jgi:hypothetical protein